MSIAIDWDHQQLRFVKTKSGRGSVVEAGRIEFDATDTSATRSEQVQAAIRQVLGDSKARVLVALPAGAVEVAALSVPPASEAELPMFVQNLCRQELGIATEDPALDFLAADKNEDGSRSVTAMLLRDEAASTVRGPIELAGATVERIVLRPHALAPFLSTGPGVRIALAVGRGQCDMLVVCDQRPVSVRSLRLPPNGAPQQLGRHCIGELKRTIFATLDDASISPVELVVIGEGEVAGEVAKALSAEFGMDASLQNPFEVMRAETRAEDSGLFAGLIGAVSPGFQPPVDFQNPRRPVKEAGRAKPILIAAACLLALVAGGSWYVWSQFNEIDQENARLEAQVRELNELVEETKPKRALAKSLSSWEAARFSWLDEIRYLTETMPPRSDLTISRLSISGGRRSATISFNGVAKKPDAVDRMEQALRDEHHAPRTPGLRERAGSRQQGWSFKTTMRLLPRTPQEYREARKGVTP